MTFSLIHLLLVAVGGGVGGIGRFWLTGAIDRRTAETFPWGTLVVNVTGAAAIGVLAGLMLEPGTHAAGQPSVWSGLVVGILGSYTTVSSFSLQTLALARNGTPLRAMLYIAASVVLCLSAAAAGYAVISTGSL